MTTFTLFTATTSGLASNTHYPNKATITDAADMEAAARFDHVAAEYQGNQRSTHGFVTSDCLIMDIDNDHSEIPDEWVTPQGLADLLASVEFMTVTSRNHNTSKHGTPPRPRFHVYLPISPVTDPAAYAGLKKSLADRFDFFDAGALDAARFLYGHPAPQVEAFTGSTLVDEWLTRQAEADAFAAFDAATLAIGEGSRNATLSRFAGRVLIRYGDTDQARTLFDRKAALCDPPLPTPELEAIWRSALRFGKKVAENPDYISPDAYAMLTGLCPDDFTDLPISGHHHGDQLPRPGPLQPRHQVPRLRRWGVVGKRAGRPPVLPRPHRTPTHPSPRQSHQGENCCRRYWCAATAGVGLQGEGTGSDDPSPA